MDFFSCSKNELKRTTVVLPFWEGSHQAELATKLYAWDFSTPTILEDFRGKEGEVLFLYNRGEKANQRVVLLGLGKKDRVDIEKLRRVYSQLTKACFQKKIAEICLFLPQGSLDENKTLTGVADGILLTNYTFNALKNVKKPADALLKRVGLVGISKNGLQVVKRCQTIAEGVYIARDLVNGNADTVTPQYLVQFAKQLVRKLPIKTTILNKSQIEKEKMGLLLAVNRGSTIDPAVIILSYKGQPKNPHHTVVVGKGITYDTGGLNLKPVASMETMKADMAGGAVALATIYVAALLNLKLNLTVVIPATENSIGSKSFKPGDVYQSANGLTVEVNNPDAEGRLVLADAITYAKKKLKPTSLIDIGTLTGGIDVALGSEACGLMSNDENLAHALLQAGNETFERVWRLPIYDEYRDSLKSDIADIKNSAGRSASSCVAAMFLHEFVEDIPWAHLDIASVAFLNEKKRYHPKFGTGFGVRLLIKYLSDYGHR